MIPHISYRVEADHKSLWYDRKGQFDPFPDEEVTRVPMGYNEFFTGNKLSAVKDLSDFPLWFSRELFAKIQANGYKMFKILSSEIIVLETQVLIPAKSIIEQIEIPFPA